MENIKPLSALKPQNQGKIKSISNTGNLKRRLLDMGIVPGSLVEVVKVAPLGDPIDVKVKGYHLSLRKEEAGEILVEEER